MAMTTDLPAVSKEQAQRRVDRVAAFRAELTALEQAGVLQLSAPQKADVERYHASILRGLAEQFDIDRSDAQKQMSLAMRLASLLGAITLSVAAFLFFYRFWGSLSTPVQVTLLGLAPLLAVVGVEVAARREQTLYFASLMAIVAFACFVLDLSVLGAIFNMQPSPGAMLAWGAFALALAYGYGLRVLLLTGLALMAGYLAALLTAAAGLDWSSFALRPESFMLAGAVVFALASARFNRSRAGFPAVFRSAGSIGLLAPLLVLCTEVGPGLSFLPLSGSVIRGFYDVLGFGLGGLAVWLGIRRQWREVTNIGSAFAVLFLYVKLFDWFWEWMPRYAFFLTLGLVAVGLLVILKRLRAHASEV